MAAVALFLALMLPSPPALGLIWTVAAAGAVAVGSRLLQTLSGRAHVLLLRNNVIIRSQAEGAREAERQRIAADFHDGPLQSFISFQMRLEVIKKLLARDVERPRKNCSSFRTCAGPRWRICAASCAACVPRTRA